MFLAVYLLCTPRPVASTFFLAEGLAEDVAEGLPEENPKGGLQSTPRAQIEFSRDRPRAQIHMATLEAFPQIVILSKSQKSCVGFH